MITNDTVSLQSKFLWAKGIPFPFNLINMWKVKRAFDREESKQAVERKTLNSVETMKLLESLFMSVDEKQRFSKQGRVDGGSLEISLYTNNKGDLLSTLVFTSEIGNSRNIEISSYRDNNVTFINTNGFSYEISDNDGSCYASGISIAMRMKIMDLARREIFR